MDSGIGYKRPYTSHMPRQNNKWFDEECQQFKAQLTKLGKVVSSGDSSKLHLLALKKKEFKKLVRKKKCKFYDNEIKELSKDSLCPNDFWKRLKRLNNTTKSQSPQQFHPKEVVTYFKSLLNTDREPQFPETSLGPNLEIWDKLISKKELDASFQSMKKGKSVGLDIINLELIMEMYNCFPDTLITLYNNILQSGKFPPAWSTALVVLIHKKR